MLPCSLNPKPLTLLAYECTPAWNNQFVCLESICMLFDPWRENKAASYEFIWCLHRSDVLFTIHPDDGTIKGPAMQA
jgi:hypothetical protein